MRLNQLRVKLLAVLLAVLAVGAWNYTRVPYIQAAASEDDSTSLPISAVSEADGYIFEVFDEQVGCRSLTQQEVASLAERDPKVLLHVISPIRPLAAAGLRITLRATQQLESFPQAKAAFIRAAGRWEALIESPISIIIDVDFGPTRFGRPFDEETLGSATSQTLIARSGYSFFRNQLIATASNNQEATLYNLLPTNKVKTTAGKTKHFISPSTVFRVLGAIPPVADPDRERDEGLGDPPAIGFNSRFTFDFDPNDGIDADKFDFDAIATHEIGHVLGFTSAIERSESSPRAVSILDLFRFRPGVTLGTFTRAKRVLTEGGEHVFFAGDTELPLSSGRSEEMGADGLQAGHWKARRFIGVYIGIMVPEIARGERQVITGNDLEAYDTFGYRLAAGASGLQQF